MSVIEFDLPQGPRDYTLGGPEAARAVERGLVSADWYQTPVDRKMMKDLMRRSNGPAIRDTAIWLGLLVTFGVLGVLTWGTGWAVPVFIIYGVLYATAADSRWLECGHGTAFKTPWMNAVVLQIGNFLLIASPIMTWWSGNLSPF